jgi:histidinol dehydrogenase
MRRIELTDPESLVAELHAGAAPSAEVREAVAGVLDMVRERGDAALREFTERFDGVKLGEPFKLPPAKLNEALAALPVDLREALRVAAANIRAYHECELPEPWRAELAQGQVVGQEIVPLQTAGLYVPGGLADYPSTVLMTAIPAQVAGVGRLVACSPPRDGGSVPPGVAAACAMLGISDVVPIGGAQAIAAMAFGTDSVPRCDVIVGPGNRYVTEAKRQVMGRVAIDSLAGPSEVLIVADRHADASWVAADVLAQAEHGAGAMGAVLSLDCAFADVLAPEIERLAVELGMATDDVVVIDCPSVAAAVELVNAFAPEHLELHVLDAEAVLGRVRNAGAVFVGRHTATAFADYAAGTNHVLPTGGAARFAQGLSVSTFLKRVGVLALDETAAAALAPAVARIATEEGFAAHARSAQLRAGKER